MTMQALAALRKQVEGKPIELPTTSRADMALTQVIAEAYVRSISTRREKGLA